MSRYQNFEAPKQVEPATVMYLWRLFLPFMFDLSKCSFIYFIFLISVLIVAGMSRVLFNELSEKGNTLYNVLPDIISCLSNPESNVPEEKFRAIIE